MVKVLLDAGHGGKDGGAQGNGLSEKVLTLAIAQRCREILQKEYIGAEVRLTRETDQFLSLTERTNLANSWRADLLVSIHINAAVATAGNGFESFVYIKSDAATKAFQNVLHKAVIRNIKITDRGQKSKDLHMVRQSAMIAVLTENGFISNVSDAAKMKSAAWLESCARGHAEGIAEYAGLKRKPAAQPAPAIQPKPAAQPAEAQPADRKKIFRVQVGAFEDRANADKLAAELTRQGYRPFIWESEI